MSVTVFYEYYSCVQALILASTLSSVGKYYYWNRKTNVTTWTNPFESASAPLPSASAENEPASEATVQAESSTSKDGAKSQSPQPKASGERKADKAASNDERADSSGPSAADFGGIDPDLAYLDPSLASRARGAGGAGAHVARFNARTGKFEADPTKNPDRVSDVQRAKRQNQFYFDYDGWQATLAQQQEQNALKRAAEGDYAEDESNKKHRPSKKEMEAIRARNKEKKEKKQKGWLMG